MSCFHHPALPYALGRRIIHIVLTAPGMISNSVFTITNQECKFSILLVREVRLEDGTTCSRSKTWYKPAAMNTRTSQFRTYREPSTPLGSVCIDSTNYRLKILQKIPYGWNMYIYRLISFVIIPWIMNNCTFENGI